MNREYGPIEFTPEVEREAEIIYSLLMGEYKPEQLSPQALRVKNFCAVGTPFSALYDEMLDAYDRLSERLHPGEDQDEDVEVFFDNFLHGCHEVGVAMYQYDRYFAAHPDKYPPTQPCGG